MYFKHVHKNSLKLAGKFIKPGDIVSRAELKKHLSEEDLAWYTSPAQGIFEPTDAPKKAAPESVKPAPKPAAKATTKAAPKTRRRRKTTKKSED